ncbi:hypothetical protein KKH36_03270 [Patescibacteria group bacterium]|nr:hypothetical protein [Patescibacteria group bacterium]
MESKEIVFYGKNDPPLSVILLEDTDSLKMAEDLFLRLNSIVSVPCGEADYVFQSREGLVEYLEKEKQKMLSLKRDSGPDFASCENESLIRYFKSLLA